MPNYNVFISYRGSGSGGLLGKEIYTDLRHCKSEDGEPDIVPFFAPACIQKGEDFKRAIDTVLKSVSCVILILSPGYFENCRLEDDMVRFELETALANPNISFIPVVMDGFSFEDEIKSTFNLPAICCVKVYALLWDDSSSDALAVSTRTSY